MSSKEKLEKTRKQIMSKSFSTKKPEEKSIILETYTEQCLKIKEIEDRKIELEIKDRENERNYKKFFIKAIIISIAVFLEIVVLILFLVTPSELGVKALDICLVAIAGLIALLFGIKNEKSD